MQSFLMKWGIIAAIVAVVGYYFMPYLIFFGVLIFIGFISGSGSSNNSHGHSSGLSEDDLDGERDPAWNGRDMNEIYDNDGLGDWDLDGKREEKF